MGVLSGKSALVTGASRGIGREIVRAFSREGAQVAAAARSKFDLEALCAEVAAEGGRATPVVLDLRSEESIINAISTAKAALGRIDVLVNNAAIIALKKITETSSELWDEVMSTNVRGVFIACREVLPEMIERRSGRIINIGSTAGRRGYVDQGAYCASKHALAGLSKVLAIEAQPYNVRVQMLSPGGVLTGLSSELRSSRGEAEDSPEWMTAAEIAQAAVYLCSQDGAAISDELILRRFAAEPWR